MRKANNKKETGSKVILIRFSCLYHSPQVVFMLIRKEIDCNMAFPLYFLAFQILKKMLSLHTFY